MRHLILIASLTLILGACASSDPHSNTGDAHVVVKPTTDYGAAYQVQLRNYENEDINLNNRDTRLDILDEVLAEYCDDGYIIKREEVVAEGLLDGKRRRDNFYVYATCR